MDRKSKPADARAMGARPAGGDRLTSCGRRRPSVGRGLLAVIQGFLITFAIAARIGVAVPAQAAEIKTHGSLTIEVDKAEMIELPGPASTVFVANPDIADVQVPGAPNATKFLVFGKKVGNTTVYALTHTGRVVSYAISVRRQLGEIASALKKEVPGAAIEVSSAPNGITVSGTVESPHDAQELKAAARQFLGEKDSVNFNVAVAGATQVNLRIRVVEITRNIEKEFGFNWGALYNNGTVAIGLLTGRAPLNTVVNSVTGASTTSFGNFSRSTATPNTYDSIGLGYMSKGGAANISGLIDALAEEDLITVLAEPNLTAASGETANFLAGGEFPIPVPQALEQITIEWKRFGVSVDFTPTVIDANRLSIKVRPEVSELSTTGAVTLDSITVPALTVRRADTTVELASGQSFAIAGLYQNNITSQLGQYPWLGDLPILGTLFRSSLFQRNESELVIIVTPYIVRPVTEMSDLHVPTEGLVFATDLERVLLGRSTSAFLPATATPHLSGAAGFMLER